MTEQGLMVVKVGGSLFDWPELADRLRGWLEAAACRSVLLVPGGGATADVVRQLDQLHGLGNDRAHWLALKALSVNAVFLAQLVKAAALIADPRQWMPGKTCVLDCHCFAHSDQGRPGSLPASWDVTSDAVAARAAVVAQARRLVLLKSIAIPTGCDWTEAGRRGWVDALFGDIIATAPGLDVQSVNLRAWRSAAAGS